MCVDANSDDWTNYGKAFVPEGWTVADARISCAARCHAYYWSSRNGVRTKLILARSNAMGEDARRAVNSSR